MNTFGLIGYPLGHSFSKSFFEKKFETEQIDAEYLNFEISSINKLEDIISSTPTLLGFNVTIPYKQEIIPLLTELTSEAKAIGAVNVVRIEKDSQGVRLIGYNSDVFGFTESLKPLLKPHHTKALVFGTGGASKAVVYGLTQLGIGFQYVSRKKSINSISYDDLTPDIIANHTLLINCTPLGMHPDLESKPDIPYSALTDKHLFYDLVYNPENTAFLRAGEKQGASTKNGLEMLHLQALKAWEIWNKA